MKPQIGDKIKVITKNGNKLCIIVEILDNKIYFKNKKFGLTVDSNRVNSLMNLWYQAKFEYISFN